MGSGTTAMACVAEKRNFVGSELNKEYFELATKRNVALAGNGWGYMQCEYNH